MKVAIIGAAGNMGRATLAALVDADFIDGINLLGHNRKRTKKLIRKQGKLRGKIRVTEGSVADSDACRELIDGVDVVVNMGAVIPPLSDKHPEYAVECNQTGVDVLVSEIEKAERQPILVHVSTVALYGNRTGNCRYGRVGDPLTVSPFDVYSVTKLRGEFRVLESGIKTWAVLRQSAMLHPQMLADNLHDGLMFHTCFDAPLEWVTAHDSAVLIRNLLARIADGSMPQDFWKKVYNIGGGKINRCYGCDTLSDGFALIGGKFTDFFQPYYNATRNFHGTWFADGQILDELFHYQSQSTQDYWNQIIEAHPVYKLGRTAPKSLVRHFAVKRLLKDSNSPAYWHAHGDTARLTAYFGSPAAYDELCKKSWQDVPLPDRKQIPDYDETASSVYYGYDISAPDDRITREVLESVAEAHGGKLLTDEFTAGDMYRKLEWETQDGERFTATPYTVLRAGHWYNPIYREYVWDFDRLSKRDKVFASVWYESHGREENIRYRMDEKFAAYMEKSE